MQIRSPSGSNGYDIPKKTASNESDDYSISPGERRNLEICAKQYARTIVILNVGSSFDTAFYKEIPGIHALVYMSQLGMNGGAALAEVLTGKVTPSGKLSETWAARYEDIPFGEEFSHSGDEADYKDHCADQRKCLCRVMKPHHRPVTMVRFFCSVYTVSSSAISVTPRRRPSRKARRSCSTQRSLTAVI